MLILLWAIIAFVVIAADQFVKIWILGNVALGDTFFSFPPLFDFTFVKNTGAAFSILSGKVSVLSVISVAFCIGVIIYWIIKKPKNLLLCSALTLLFSGAAGNAVDRIMYGYVVDYIRILFVNFPIFNIADVAITVGAVLLVLYVIIFDKGDSKND